MKWNKQYLNLIKKYLGPVKIKPGVVFMVVSTVALDLWISGCVIIHAHQYKVLWYEKFDIQGKAVSHWKISGLKLCTVNPCMYLPSPLNLKFMEFYDLESGSSGSGEWIKDVSIKF